MRKRETTHEIELCHISTETFMEALASFKKTTSSECMVRFVEHGNFAEVNFVKHGVQAFVRIPMGGWSDNAIETIEKGVFDYCRHAWVSKLYN